MLFGDRHIVVAVGEALRVLDQTRAFAHRGRDADDVRIALGHVAQPLAEDLRIRRAGAGFLENLAARRVERAGAMPFDRIRFRRRIAFALARHDMQELGAMQLLYVVEGGDQRFDIVAIHRSDVIETHLFEQRAWQYHALQMLLGAAREFPDRGHLAQHLLPAFAQMRVHAARQGARQVIGECADVFRNRHVVVVQDDQQVGGRRTCMIERLEGHAGGQRAVADDRDRAAILAAFGGGDGHAQCGADRGARVTHAEGIVFAFGTRRKRRQAIGLLDGMEPPAAAGEHLVRIGLVPHVPHQPVIGGVEHVVQGDGQFDRTQACCKVASTRADAVNQELTQFRGQFGEFGQRQAA